MSQSPADGSPWSEPLGREDLGIRICNPTDQIRNQSGRNHGRSHSPFAEAGGNVPVGAGWQKIFRYRERGPASYSPGQTSVQQSCFPGRNDGLRQKATGRDFEPESFLFGGCVRQKADSCPACGKTAPLFQCQGTFPKGQGHG